MRNIQMDIQNPAETYYKFKQSSFMKNWKRAFQLCASELSERNL